jgi:hypothetical protein
LGKLLCNGTPAFGTPLEFGKVKGAGGIPGTIFSPNNIILKISKNAKQIEYICCVWKQYQKQIARI